MSTPDPVVSPPPPNNTKKWLVGCAIALVVVVVLIIGAAVAIIYAAKRQVDAAAGDAKHLAEQARRAAKALESTTPAAQDIAKAAEARMRLGRAAAAVAWAAQQGAKKTEACPPELARNALPVDAPWFASLVDGIPDPASGTPWMRDPAIIAAASDADSLKALVALDRELASATAIAAIHATQLTEPSGGSAKFDGFVQLVGYPDGDTTCMVPFHAEGATGSDFQSAFWAAEGAALGK